MLTEKLATYRLNRESFYNIYLWTISASGFALVLWALTQIPSYPSLTNFLLLVLLSALAAQATTSITVGKNAGITYHVGSAIGLATLPLLGISSYILLLAAYVATLACGSHSAR